MATNSILLTNDVIEFNGFELIEDKLTFCFYSGGIAIVPDWKPEKLSCHYECRLDKNSHEKRIIKDLQLVNLLKNRGIKEKDSFVQINNHYIEVEPHSK